MPFRNFNWWTPLRLVCARNLKRDHLLINLGTSSISLAQIISRRKVIERWRSESLLGDSIKWLCFWKQILFGGGNVCPPWGKLVFLRTAEMLKYYRLLQFSLLPCKSRSRYVIFCEVFNIFLFVFTFYSELEFHVPPFGVKLRNNKSVLANCQTGRPQYDRFLMEHNAKKRDESKCSQW